MVPATEAIDVHAHCVPGPLLERLADGEVGSVSVVAEGEVTRLRMSTGLTAPIVPGLLAEDARIARMDKAGIGQQIVSSFIDIGAQNVTGPDAATYARVLNEEMAAFAGRHPGRLIGLATLPMTDPGAAVEELGRATAELGLVGAEIGANGLDDPALEPLWEQARELGSILLIHPGGSTTASLPMFLGNLVVNPAETTIAAASLILAGVLERHPGLTVILVHGGGFLPYQWGRLRHGARTYGGRFGARLAEMDVRDHLRCFYYDTIVHSTESLDVLVGLVGADRVLAATDEPFPMGDADPVATVRSSSVLSPEDEALILRGNAQKLLDRARSAVNPR